MNTSLKVMNIRVPSFGDLVTASVNATESFLSTHIGNTVKFLDEHPGIAMALSPTAITRRVAYKHVDTLVNRR
jgi:hypothetical protein